MGTTPRGREFLAPSLKWIRALFSIKTACTHYHLRLVVRLVQTLLVVGNRNRYRAQLQWDFARPIVELPSLSSIFVKSTALHPQLDC